MPTVVETFLSAKHQLTRSSCSFLGSTDATVVQSIRHFGYSLRFQFFFLFSLYLKLYKIFYDLMVFRAVRQTVVALRSSAYADVRARKEGRRGGVVIEFSRLFVVK